MKHLIMLSFDVINPEILRINKRDSVTWVNESPEIHSVVFKSGDYESKDLRQGEEFSLVFEGEGEYDYYCEDNESMVGRIVVN